MDSQLKGELCQFLDQITVMESKSRSLQDRVDGDLADTLEYIADTLKIEGWAIESYMMELEHASDY